MRLVKGAMWTLVALAAMPVMAQAPDAAKLAKAQQLFEVMHMDTVYARMVDQIEQSVRSSESQLFPQNNLTPALKQEQDNFQEKVFALVGSEIAWPHMEPDVAKLYADAYTADQLDGLIAFYRSPLGQAVLAKTPELLKGSQAIAQQHLAVILPQMQQIMHDEAAKIQSMTGTTPSPGTNK